MRGSKIAVRMAGLPFEKPRIWVPSRPLPAGTTHWLPVPHHPQNNPFLPRVLWTVEGYQGVHLIDPAPHFLSSTPRDPCADKLIAGSRLPGGEGAAGLAPMFVTVMVDVAPCLVV